MFGQLLTNYSDLFRIEGGNICFYKVSNVNADMLKKVMDRVRSSYSRRLNRNTTFAVLDKVEEYVELFGDINKIFEGNYDFVKNYDYYLNSNDELINPLYLKYGRDIMNCLTLSLVYKCSVNDVNDTSLCKIYKKNTNGKE